MRIGKDFRSHLAYVCKTERGYLSDLEDKVGTDTLAQFESVGFITKGHTLKNETWRKTNLADSYFKEMFGWWAFFRLKR